MGRLNKFTKILIIFSLILGLFFVSLAFLQILPSTKVNADTAEIKNSKSVKILFFGDLMLDRHVKEKITDKKLDYLFAGLKNSNFNFKQYDIVTANLEGAVTNGGNHYPPVNAYDFAFDPALVSQLKNYNFKILNLANNHLADQGERGINETRANLAKLGFKYYGCQDAEVSDCSSYIYNAGNLKIGFVGFSAVYKKIDMEKAKKIVVALKNKTDLVVATVHGGVEYNHNFNKTQQALAHGLIDAGADVIVGHHPHVVQGVEVYKNKLIFYSLGNFIFDQYFSRDTQEELALEFNFSSAGQARAVLYPLISKQSQPSLMTGKDKENYLKKIAGWSKGDKKLLEQIKKGEIVINF